MQIYFCFHHLFCLLRNSRHVENIWSYSVLLPAVCPHSWYFICRVTPYKRRDKNTARNHDTGASSFLFKDQLFLLTSTVVRRLHVLCFVYAAYGRYMWKTGRGVCLFLSSTTFIKLIVGQLCHCLTFGQVSLRLTCWNQSFEISYVTLKEYKSDEDKKNVLTLKSF